MVDNLTSKYNDISLMKTKNLNEVTDLFNSNNADIKYDYFNFYINTHSSDTNVFVIKNKSAAIGIIALYNVDMINKTASIYGFIIEKMYYVDLLKALISSMNHAFTDLHLNKLNFTYREDNYFFDDVCKHLHFINEGILRNLLYHNEKYHNILTNSILTHEYKRLVGDDYKKMYTWNYEFTPNNFIQINIDEMMDGRAFTNDITNGNKANLNDLREFVLSKDRPTGDCLRYKNTKFNINIFDTDKQYDNIVCKSQEIEVAENYYSDILLVTMAQFGHQKSYLTLIYEDDTIELREFNISDWCERVLCDEYVIYYAFGCRNLHRNINIVKGDSFIFLKRVVANPEKKLKSIILPNNRNINIFALGACLNEVSQALLQIS